MEQRKTSGIATHVKPSITHSPRVIGVSFLPEEDAPFDWWGLLTKGVPGGGGGICASGGMAVVVVMRGVAVSAAAVVVDATMETASPPLASLVAADVAAVGVESGSCSAPPTPPSSGVWGPAPP
jgi:hypothetical protein